MKLRTRGRAWTQTALTKHAARRVCSISHSARNLAPSSGPERNSRNQRAGSTRGSLGCLGADHESSRSLRGSPAERLALGRGKQNPPL